MLKKHRGRDHHRVRVLTRMRSVSRQGVNTLANSIVWNDAFLNPLRPVLRVESVSPFYIAEGNGTL